MIRQLHHLVYVRRKTYVARHHFIFAVYATAVRLHGGRWGVAFFGHRIPPSSLGCLQADTPFSLSRTSANSSSRRRLSGWRETILSHAYMYAIRRRRPHSSRPSSFNSNRWIHQDRIQNSAVGFFSTKTIVDKRSLETPEHSLMQLSRCCSSMAAERASGQEKERACAVKIDTPAAGDVWPQQRNNFFVKKHSRFKI